MKKALAFILILCMLLTTAPLSVASGGSSPAPAESDYVANEIILTQDTSLAGEPLPFVSAEIIDTTALNEPGVRTLKGTVAYGTDIEALCKSLREREDILFADPNYIQTIDSIELPQEAQQSSSEYNGFNWYRDALHLTEAWQSADTLGSEDITVAVLDTGVNIYHKEFEGAIWEDADHNRGYNAIDGSNNVSDANGHGSNVAGIIAMRSNAFGYVGIAPQVKIMPIKVAASVSMSDDAILDGLNYAVENGADIVNMSFGGGSVSDTMAMAYQSASRKAVLIAAAGNSGMDCAYAPQYPAACNGVLGVMSYGDYSNEARSHYSIDNGVLSSFSNYDKTGKYYQIAAPGVDIEGPSNKNNTDCTNKKSGTSQATPIVAGAAALYMSLHPQASAYQVKNALINGTDSTVSGYGDDSTLYKKIDIAGTLSETPCEDPVVPLSARARTLLSSCYGEELSEVHQSDMDALCILSSVSVPQLSSYMDAVPELNTVQILAIRSTNLTTADFAWLKTARFENLYKLDLTGNYRLSALEFSEQTAPLLRELYADNCALTSADSLENLHSLVSLSLCRNRFFTSYQFEKLSFLQEIDLSQCLLQDVRAFADFHDLSYLNLYDNYITDISPLVSFAGRYFNIQRNPLALGSRQDYYIDQIDASMKAAPYSLDNIYFYHDSNNGSDGKNYIKAEQMSLPAQSYTRTQQSALLQTVTAPEEANTNSYARFESQSTKAQVDALSGAMHWDAADFPQSERITVRYLPVAGFPEGESTVEILAPAIKEFYFDGGFVLRANAATDYVMLGTTRLSESYADAGSKLFVVPSSVSYSGNLVATAYDAFGAGSSVHIGTRQSEPEEDAHILRVSSDKEEYFTGETATLSIVADSNTNNIKIYDCNYHSTILLSAYSEQGEERSFTCRVPLGSAGSYRFKCYASATEQFSIGATVIRFSALQKAQSFKLTSASDSSLYLSEGCDSLQLTPEFLPKTAARENVSYRSLDPAVATVDSSGKVSAVGYGQTAVVAESESGLSAALPIIVAVPKINEPAVSETYVGETCFVTVYTKGADDVLLKNADGSDCAFAYQTQKQKSNISGYDALWTVSFVPESGDELNLKLYAADDNGITMRSNYRCFCVAPIEPVQSFDFEESSYRFERSGGAVKISLNVVPATSSEFFNWSISTNTVAKMDAFENYCILTPKKSGSLELTASTMIGDEEVDRTVTVTFTEGKIYTAATDVTAVDLYEEFPVTVKTDTSITYLDIMDSNSLSIEYTDYTYYEDEGGYRYWTLPFHFKRDASFLKVIGGDSVGNVSSSVQLAVSATMPQESFAANPPVVMGRAGKLVNFHLIALPSRANINFDEYSVVAEDPEICSFNLGNLRLNKEGETTLHCTYGEEHKDVRVIVSAPIEEITLAQSSVSLCEGESYIIQAQVTPESHEIIRYTSSDESVAAVSAVGVISATGIGTATITLQAENGVSTSLQVKVKPTTPVTALSFDKALYEIQVSDALPYTLFANADTTNQLTYSSSNTNLLSVNEQGEYLALKEGEVTVTVRSDSGATATAIVRITAERRLALSRPQMESTPKSTITISAMLTPDTADLDGYWFSDDESVAVVLQGSKSGAVYTKTPGTCRIYFISTRGEIASCLLKVNNIALSRITLAETEIEMAVHENHIISYTGNISFSAEKPTWHSENEAIAAVDQNGILYGVSEGTTTVFASLANGKTYPISVTVNATELTLSGVSTQSAQLTCTNVLGTTQSYDVNGSFTIAPFACGTYTFELTALHHTSITITDAAVFSCADLGKLTLHNGDANGDGVVDIADISLLLNQDNYGAAAGSTRRNMDMDDNGVINIADIREILLAENFGSSDIEIIY
ncbi:MAG: S8 family serine peptidase [Clostridia bacterium]|nr:S8 family serine peptidase [Clostridia bacterium]